MPPQPDDSPAEPAFVKRAGIALILCALLTAAGLVVYGVRAHSRRQARIDWLVSGGIRAVNSLAELGEEIVAEYEKAPDGPWRLPQGGRGSSRPVRRRAAPVSLRVFRHIRLTDLDIPAGLKVMHAQVLIPDRAWIVGCSDSSRRGPQSLCRVSGSRIASPDRRVSVTKGTLYDTSRFPVMTFQVNLKPTGSKTRYSALIVVDIRD
ncbi:MAG: hypothetical protein ACYTGB_06375 [Planctomycetota bacterium]|jgi:hypothetical protein